MGNTRMGPRGMGPRDGSQMTDQTNGARSLIDLGSERLVLGALLNSRGALAFCSDLHVADFGPGPHARIFRGIESVFVRHEPVNMATVTPEAGTDLAPLITE